MGAWDEIGSAHVRPTQSVDIPLRGDLPDLIAQLEAEARREAVIDARENRPPVAPRIARRIQALEDDLAASVRTFTFRALGRQEAREMEAAHPPTPEQQEEAAKQGRRYSWNPETYPAALIAASCIAPEGITIEDARRVVAEWSDGEFTLLWTTCLAVNAGSVDVGPKSEIASSILNGSGQNSTTASR